MALGELLESTEIRLRRRSLAIEIRGDRHGVIERICSQNVVPQRLQGLRGSQGRLERFWIFYYGSTRWITGYSVTAILYLG